MLIIKALIILSYLIAFTTALYCDYRIAIPVNCIAVYLYLDSNF